MATKKWRLSYRNGMRYELFFRKIALSIFHELVSSEPDPARQRIWAHLYQLEEDAMRRMRPLRNRLKLNPAVGRCGRQIARAGATALNKSGSGGLNYVAGSAGRFIKSLEAIAAKAPESDRDLVRQMIEHEKLVKEVVEALRDKRTDIAQKLLNDYRA